MEVYIGNTKIPNKYIDELTISNNIDTLTRYNVPLESIDISDILGQGYSIECNIEKESANAFYKCTLNFKDIPIATLLKRTIHGRHNKYLKKQSIYCYTGLFLYKKRIAVRITKYTRVFSEIFNNTHNETEDFIPLVLSIKK